MASYFSSTCVRRRTAEQMRKITCDELKRIPRADGTHQGELRAVYFLRRMQSFGLSNRGRLDLTPGQVLRESIRVLVSNGTPADGLVYDREFFQ